MSVGRHALLLVVVISVAASGCRSERTRSDSPTASAAEGSGSPEGVQLCEHGVPADLCTQCNSDLIAVFQATGDWCEEHGLPESHCRLCHPDLDFTKAAEPQDWCREHQVPESKCTKCHPRLVAQFIEAGDYCRQHGFPESVCPRCHPELVQARAGEVNVVAPQLQVRLASAGTEKDAGIETAIVREGPVAKTLQVVGTLDFNQNRRAELSARSEALVVQVHVDVGDDVRAGQPLVTLSSGAVGGNRAQMNAARARLDAATRAVSRERALLESGFSTPRDLDEALREEAAARAEIEAAGAALDAAGAGRSGTRGTYVLSAPFAGTVVARQAVAGKSAEPGQLLVAVADLHTMWAQLDVPEEDASALREGQRVTLRFDGLRGESRQGVLSRVAPTVDPHTRTVRARVELPNPGRQLRAGLFFHADILVSSPRRALLIPRRAVQYVDEQPVVFVRKDAGLYTPVSVELGLPVDENIEVIEGLSAGAEVVTTGAFLLKTEILKDSIGAGCCEIDSGSAGGR